MKTNKPNIPISVGSKVWIVPNGGEFSHQFITIFTPEKRKLKADFYIFLFKGATEDQDQLLIIKSNYIRNYTFFASAETVQDFLTDFGLKKYAEHFSPDLPHVEQIYVDRPADNVIVLHAAIPKEETAGFMPQNPTSQPVAENIAEDQPQEEIIDPDFTVNKGE